MNKLSPEKRNHLILAAVGTVVVLILIYIGIIGPEKKALARIEKDKSAARSQLQEIQDGIKKADVTSSQLANAIYELSQAETDVASGDIYAWVNDTIRRFKANYRGVDIPVIGQPTSGEVDVLTGIPYKQLKVTLSGTAYYHDLGRFFSELENTYPHIRLANLSMEPSGGGGGDNEKLSFKVDFIALLKPNTRESNSQ